MEEAEIGLTQRWRTEGTNYLKVLHMRGREKKRRPSRESERDWRTEEDEIVPALGPKQSL